jgi:ABC-type transport system involved in multi-copper enzyme maturation permease subunit
MKVLPVMERELRAEARQRFTYWLRVVGAAAMVVVFTLTLVDQRGGIAELGARLFGGLNAAFFATIWLLVPLLTADCISRERREGTLGLLFLTPLTPRAIVVGKGLSQGLRALTVFLAVLPMMTLPFLLGGVTWKDAALALALDAAALILALGAGLLASSLAKDWVRVLVLAEGLSVLLALSFMAAHYLGSVYLDAVWGLSAQRLGRSGYQTSPWGLAWSAFWDYGLGDRLKSVISMATGFSVADSRLGLPAGWKMCWLIQPPAFQRALACWAAGLVVGSFLVLGLIVLLAALRLERSWREEVLSARQVWFLETFCTPRFWRSVFRGKMRRALDRNPIGWLQQYAWSARLIKWGWCLFIVIVECWLITDPSLEYLWSGQYWLNGLLLLSLAFSAAGSFRQERQSGAMELLLVTPLKVGQIIGGRLRGLWSQFLPAVVLLTLVWLHLLLQLQFLLPRYGDDPSLVSMVFLLSSYLVLPVVGLYFSMRRSNFIVTWLLTLVCGICLPWLFGRFIALVSQAETPFLIVLLSQAAVAGAAGWLLRCQLVQRRFVLS